MPEAFIRHFIAKVGEETADVICPDSVKYETHRALPYREKCARISYKSYDLAAVKRVLEEQNVLQLRDSVAFCHFEKIALPLDGTTTKMSMKENIEKMKNAAKIGYTEWVTQAPTSHSSLVVPEGEGRSTREMEIIYWPNLYSFSKMYKFQLRFFVQKCELQ